MINNEVIKEYEKEYLDFINETIVSPENLEKCGVSRKVFAAEHILRSVFGDEIIINSVQDDSVADGSTKVIEKIGETEMAVDTMYKSLCDDIDNSEFDKEFDSLLITFDGDSSE